MKNNKKAPFGVFLCYNKTMEKIKIYLICWLVSKLRFPKDRTYKAIYHLERFLELTGIKDYIFK